MRRRELLLSAGWAAASTRSWAGTPWRMPEAGSVKVTENAFVPGADGTPLAIQLWTPQGGVKAPAVLEAIPYRKRDRYRGFDMLWGKVLAERGIAYARLETRGSGDSGGVLEDEYLASEQADCAAVIAWLAKQPWCNGAVGMRGVSWGGFSTLQTAMLNPPALKAIMPMSASDMRYTDDAHYLGGAFALTGLKWATSMKVVMAGPPDPQVSGEAWLAKWKARLAATPPIAARWLSHQTNDAYWSHGSVALDWGAIKCPTYVVGGLVDSYGNELPRLLSHLKVPRKGVYGPWQHGYPWPATPGPALDWAYEEVRWWRQHLMGEETGIMAEPMLRAFMPEATAAQVSPGPIPGRWVADPSWPPSRPPRALHFGAGGLHEAPQPAETVAVAGDRVVGLGKVEWVPFAPTELPREQSADDARSHVFDTPPLPADVEILGAGALKVRVSADKPVAHLAVRVCDVGPDGKSWLVTYGILNLTHRDGDAQPKPLEPGRAYEVTVPLNFTAHSFKAGRRIRAAVSESLWPLVWPSPEVATVTVDLAQTRLELPVRPRPPAEPPMPIALQPPMPADPAGWPRMEIAEAGGAARVVEAWPDHPSEVADVGETLGGGGPNVTLSYDPRHPSSCRWRGEQYARFSRPGWEVAVRAQVTVTADARAFHVEESTVATLNGETVLDRPHVTTIPRRFM